MNNSSSIRLRSAISDVFLKKVDVDTAFSGFEISEEHKGAYITYLDGNNVVYENGILKESSNLLSSTFKSLCENVGQIKENHKLVFYVVKDVIYLKDKTDWDMSKDGVFFQWGNRFRGVLLPHETQSVSGNKIKMLDRLCSHKIGVPSSLWAYPEALVYRIVMDTYK